MNIVWNKIEIDFLRDNAGFLKDQEIAKRISLIRGKEVSIASVRLFRLRLGLKKMHGRGRCELVSMPNRKGSLSLHIQGLPTRIV